MKVNERATFVLISYFIFRFYMVELFLEEVVQNLVFKNLILFLKYFKSRFYFFEVLNKDLLKIIRHRKSKERLKDKERERKRKKD